MFEMFMSNIGVGQQSAPSACVTYWSVVLAAFRCSLLAARCSLLAAACCTSPRSPQKSQKWACRVTRADYCGFCGLRVEVLWGGTCPKRPLKK
jgi:hypothetical protein